MSRIDHRLSASHKGHTTRHDQVLASAPADAPVRSAAPAESAAPSQQSEAQAAVTLPVTPPFVRDWGVGLGNLSSIQDQEYAIVHTGGQGGGFIVIQSGAQGYLVKSGMSADGYFFGKLADASAFEMGDTRGFLHNLSRLDEVKMAGTTFRANGPVDVTGTTGADTITGGSDTDILHGLDGADSIFAGAGADIVWGGAANDTIHGAEGTDQLWGGAGLDSITGDAGDDFIVGGTGADNLDGGDGTDIVFGGGDGDTMLGGNGDDTLIGGTGPDKMTGGDGRDVFVFFGGDSGVDAGAVTASDSILDFQRGVDVIDFTQFDHLHLVTAFGGHAGEFTLTDRVGGTTISIDNDGDGVADQSILVTVDDGGRLSIDDFVL